MKKFFVVLFILVALAGAAFFFGWVQLSVPPGAYGVMNSKTHGVDPHPIQSGEFRWIWYKLIPANVTISVFNISLVERTINSRGNLPSAEIYSAFAGEQADFSWELNASFSFSIKPGELTTLVQANNIITQEDLEKYQRNLADNIESLIVLNISSPENTEELETLLGGYSEKLEQIVQEKYPVIENFTCLVKNARFPDFILYRQVRSLYEDYIAMQRDYSSSSIVQKAENRIEMEMHFEELQRYGELLTKYPILLQYLLQQKEENDQ